MYFPGESTDSRTIYAICRHLGQDYMIGERIVAKVISKDNSGWRRTYQKEAESEKAEEKSERLTLH